MEALTEFVRENVAGIVAVTVLVLPIVYFTRRYTVPVILYILEFIIYCALFHVIFNGAVRLAAWFKFESQMKMLVDEKERVDWQTPLVAFWDRTQYRPEWLFYFEVAIAIAIVVLMLRLRPMAVQKLRAKREVLTKGKAPGHAAYQPKSKYGSPKKR